MSRTELPPLSITRYPLVLLPVGLLGALTAMMATRAVRGRSSLGLLALGLGAAALAGASAFLGRKGAAEVTAGGARRRGTAHDLFGHHARREAKTFEGRAERAGRRPDRFPTISPPPKPGATRPS